MIDKNNFKELLQKLGFLESKSLFFKEFPESEASLMVDFKNEKLIYPEDKGFTVNERQTCNFLQKENFVVFECVHRLFAQGYKPQHIELEPRWKVGHGASGGRADIMVKDNSGKSLLIIECKTEGNEFKDAWKKTLINGGQLLSYVKQAGSTQFVCLYASDFLDDNVVCDYKLITLKDNIKLLQEKADEKPLSFEQAKGLDVEDIFKAWKETYHQDFATKGIFEEDITAYDIGKTKYSLKDLNPISSNDIQGKYHEFATILRQHNVSGRENAFDKLVNLFLCKIVDEKYNPEELKFYWKGIAYDDQFSLMDRLQKLYQDGMELFLGEDVVYISQEQIEKAFDFFKNDPDATKDTIKKYFKDLKFFNNNDFGFIDVHNKKLFYQNSEVLLKIVQMLQDIRLKSDKESGSEENQFLGDMFEGFLDQGVKQSEGQFFTPMPIVKFILKSLPLESILDKSDEIPKVIDFACGAGHFLNEYAKEITTIVEQKKESASKDYFEKVFGIEKEYRLSKVAKVSAFMYGQDEINIVYADALSSGKEMRDKGIKDGTFSILVANPPYSVKGFLETLPEMDRKKYNLIETVGEKSYPNNNSIETFFLERAKRLLKPGGVAGIIVPFSILTKGNAKVTSNTLNIYVATRELLLKYFDIVAIADFEAGTFGKTGTHTVTLFIRRKKENPAPADHYLNRVNAWFKSDNSKNSVFEDEHLLKAYCNHLEFSFKDYQTLLKGNPNKELLETDIFRDYEKEFDKWAEIKNRKKQKSFVELTKEKQKEELKRRFLTYVINAEKDKLYYFVLANQNPQKVLIIKSPSKSTNQMKEFLGYEWSTAKGNEGIKYLGNIQLDKLEDEDEDEGNVALEEEDKRVLSNIFNLNNITTPLYDPSNKFNAEKINYLIHRNFNDLRTEIPENLTDYVSRVSLVNMLNFSRVDFNKSISLTPKKSIDFNTKWDIVVLKDYFTINENTFDPTTQPTNKFIYVDIDSVGKGTGEINYSNEILGKDAPSRARRIAKKNEFIISSVRPYLKGFAFIEEEISNTIYSTGFFVLNSKTKNVILNKLVFNYFLHYTPLMEQMESDMGKGQYPSINRNDIDNYKFPLPPPEVQKQIIDECDKIEKEAKKARDSIVASKSMINNLYQEALAKADKTFRLSDSDIFELSIGKRVLKTEINQEGLGIPVYSANVFEPFGNIKKDLIKDFSKSSVIWGIDGDWMVNLIPKDIPFYPTDHCGVLRIKTDDVHPKYLVWILEKEGERVRFSRTNRASMDSMRGLSIKAPSKEYQKTLIKEIEKCELQLKKSQETLDSIEQRKEEVINAYLIDNKLNKVEFDIAAESEVEYKTN